jgi:hypothetical protein
MFQQFKPARSLHRGLVPFTTLPLVITAVSSVIFSLLDPRGVQANWLLEIHTGHYGPINLQPYHAYLLGLCVLILVGSGTMLSWRH